VVADAGEDVCEIGFGVQARELGGLDDGHGVGEDLAAGVGAGEEEILAPVPQQPFILPMSGRKSSFITAGILSKVADFASSIARTGRRVGSSTSRWHPAS